MVFLRKFFSFLSLISLVISIFLFFYVGIRIFQSQNTGGLPGLEGVAYIVPFGLIFLSLILVVLTFVFHLFTKKKTNWSFKKFLARWFILFFISLASFGLSLLIIKQANSSTTPPSRF